MKTILQYDISASLNTQVKHCKKKYINSESELIYYVERFKKKSLNH